MDYKGITSQTRLLNFRSGPISLEFLNKLYNIDAQIHFFERTDDVSHFSTVSREFAESTPYFRILNRGNFEDTPGCYLFANSITLSRARRLRIFAISVR